MALAWTMEIHLCWRAAARNAANPLLLLPLHTCTSLRERELGQAQPESLLTAWQRHHFPASRSRAQALPAGQVFRSHSHTFLPRRPSSSTTTPLSQDSTDPCETDGKGESVALSRFSPRLLCFLVLQSSVRAGEVIF